MTTATDVAQWMVDRIKSNKFEYQEAIVLDVESRFGSEWVYQNDSGNPAINRKVLTEFRRLHAGSIEWTGPSVLGAPSSTSITCWSGSRTF